MPSLKVNSLMLPVTIRHADPDSSEAITCLAAYFAVLVEKVAGVTPNTFPLPDPHAETYRPPNGQFLIALAGALPIGCVSLRPLDRATGEVKRLWVAPHARGQGLARRLMAEIEAHARAIGLHALKLDTNETLTEAIALYHATGWHPTAPYSPFPSTHWFAKPL